MVKCAIKVKKDKGVNITIYNNHHISLSAVITEHISKHIRPR